MGSTAAAFGEGNEWADVSFVVAKEGTVADIFSSPAKGSAGSKCCCGAAALRPPTGKFNGGG